MSNDSSNSIGQIINSQSIRLHCASVEIGKIKAATSRVEFKNNCIVLKDIRNENLDNRYNITVPYREITAIRYCFSEKISIIFIQPIHESYSKLSLWVYPKKQIGRFVPESFITIYPDDQLTFDQLKKIERDALECKPNIKIISINSSFALEYLNKSDKTTKSTRERNESSNFSKSSINKEADVIHIDDDDDDSSHSKENEERKEDSILDQAILRYPENESKPIILYGNDLNCLRDGQYLNDNIMNFYLKYSQYNNLIGDNADRIHVYDALFATHLLNYNRKRKISVGKNVYVATYNCLSDTYHSVLKKWTRDIDIFSKDFLLMPLIKDSHWFLAILCYIGNVIKNTSGVVACRTQSAKRPTIIIMDSLANSHDRQDVCRSIFEYLALELKEKRGLEQKIDHDDFKKLYPKVPQQRNYYDCGLFVLEYIERFIKNPEDIFQRLLDNTTTLQTWFNANTLHTKRAQIQQTILNMLPPDDAKKLEDELFKVQLATFTDDKDEQNTDAEKHEKDNDIAVKKKAP